MGRAGARKIHSQSTIICAVGLYALSFAAIVNIYLKPTGLTPLNIKWPQKDAAAIPHAKQHSNHI